MMRYIITLKARKFHQLLQAALAQPGKNQWGGGGGHNVPPAIIGLSSDIHSIEVRKYRFPLVTILYIYIFGINNNQIFISQILIVFWAIWRKVQFFQSLTSKNKVTLNQSFKKIPENQESHLRSRNSICFSI